MRVADSAHSAEAHEFALRALRYRDLSVRELDERLRAKGYGESERDDAIEALVRTGLVDDARYAESRAHQLAGRGAGDALIRHTLVRAGVEADLAADALLTIAPETERARIVVERRGTGPKTARYLLGKGFSEETVSRVVASESADELG